MSAVSPGRLCTEVTAGWSTDVLSSPASCTPPIPPQDTSLLLSCPWASPGHGQLLDLPRQPSVTGDPADLPDPAPKSHLVRALSQGPWGLPHIDSGARCQCERCLFFRFQTNYGGTSGAQSSLPNAFEGLPDRLRPGVGTVFCSSVSFHHPSCCLRGHGAGPSQAVLWVEREPFLTAKLRLFLAGETQPGPDLSGPRPPHTPLIPQGPSSAPTMGPRLRPALKLSSSC